LGEASAGLLHALTPEGSGRQDDDRRRVVGVLLDTGKIPDDACTTMSNITSRSLRDLLGQRSRTRVSATSELLRRKMRFARCGQGRADRSLSW
ncbi:hypothetical protein CPLU01_06526, partial [Colletotrichum plurivorum]